MDKLSWIFNTQVYKVNTYRKTHLPTWTKYSDSQANKILLRHLNVKSLADRQQTIFLVFGLTCPGFKHTASSTQGKHAIMRPPRWLTLTDIYVDFSRVQHNKYSYPITYNKEEIHVIKKKF